MLLRNQLNPNKHQSNENTWQGHKIIMKKKTLPCTKRERHQADLSTWQRHFVPKKLITSWYYPLDQSQSYLFEIKTHIIGCIYRPNMNTLFKKKRPLLILQIYSYFFFHDYFQHPIFNLLIIIFPPLFIPKIRFKKNGERYTM